LILSWVIPKT